MPTLAEVPAWPALESEQVRQRALAQSALRMLKPGHGLAEAPCAQLALRSREVLVEVTEAAFCAIPRPAYAAWPMRIIKHYTRRARTFSWPASFDI